MRFFEEVHSQLCLELRGAEFVSSNPKKHFYAFLTSRDSCYNCQNSFISYLKL